MSCATSRKRFSARRWPRAAPTGRHNRAKRNISAYFPLPRTTMLVLVCAFSGRELIPRAYPGVVRLRYHFLGFGDAMMIL